MALIIVDIKNQPDYWSAFLSLPEAVYHHDLFYTKTAPSHLRASIENSRFSGQQLVLVALQNDKAVARLVVRVSDNFINDRGGKIGLLGFFEALNEPTVVHALFDYACQWLKKQGVDYLTGPMDGDTWHKYRFSIGPYERPPFLMEPYNPAYYPGLWQSYGFEVLAEYYSKRVEDITPLVNHFERFYKRALRNGFTFRTFRKVSFDEELRILYDLSCQIFAQNYFYAEISFADFQNLYSGAKAILKEDLVWFCRDKKGKYCGFLFAMPDYFRAIQGMAGNSNLWAKLKFLMKRGQAATVNIKTLGTLPEYHGTGVGPALMYKGYHSALKRGLKRANLCLIHQENVSGRLDNDQGHLIRNYHLYHLQP